MSWGPQGRFVPGPANSLRGPVPILRVFLNVLTYNLNQYLVYLLWAMPSKSKEPHDT
jgi:hypothetical protein